MKDKEFVEIDYIGSIKETGEPFDFTVGDEAKKHNAEKPIVVILGAGHVIKGLDDEIRKHKVGDEFEIDISPESAFGPRIGKLIKLIPFREFKKHDLSPYPGMRVDFDGIPGTVRSASGGRIIVDFNHPLAGKSLHYWVRINKKLVKKKEQADAVLGFYDLKDFSTTLTSEKLTIKSPETVPEPVQNAIKQALEQYIGLKMVNFQLKSKPKKSK